MKTSTDPLDRVKNQELSLRDVYYTLFRYKWRIMLSFLVTFLIVATFTSSRPDIYQSEAKLMIQLGRESVTLDPTATTGSMIHVSQSRGNEINTAVEILNSRDLLESVVDAIGPEEILKGLDEGLSLGGKGAGVDTVDAKELNLKLKPAQGNVEPKEGFAERERAIEMLLNGFEFEALKETNIIKISNYSHRPELAQKVLSELINLYLEKHIAVHRVAGSYEFFVEQSGHLRNQLSELEDEIRFLKNKTGISSPEQYRVMHLERIVRMEQEIEQTESELAFSTAKVEALRKILNTLPQRTVQQETAGHRNPAADRLRERLYELQLQERELLSKFDEESRVVQVVQEQLAEVQSLLKSEDPTSNLVTMGLNSTHENLHMGLLTELATLSALQAKADVLKGKLKAAQDRLESLTADEVEITRLLREVEIRETSYRKYSENLEQVRIDHALDTGKISNISIIQPATLPTQPTGSAKHMILVLGFLLSLACAAGVALCSAYFDHSIITPEQVEQKLELPTLTSIPRVWPASVSPVKKPVGKGSLKKNRNALSLNQWGLPERIKENYTSIYEQLHRRIQSGSHPLQVIAVTSCGRGEGASTIAANLATTLAQQNGGGVLLVDTDFNRPAVHQIFKASLSPGLTDVLSNGHISPEKLNGTLIQTSPVSNLSLLAAGMPKLGPSDTFNIDKFYSRLKMIRTQYRFIVLDLPALDEMSSVIGLAGLCDGLVLVVESERFRWEAIKSHKDSLVNANANILGVVINKRRFPIPEWLYQTL